MRRSAKRKPRSGRRPQVRYVQARQEQRPPRWIRRRRERSWATPRGRAVVTLLTALFMVVLGGWQIAHLLVVKDILRHGVPTVATVTEVEIRPSRSPLGDRVVVEFVLPTHRRVVAEVSEFTWSPRPERGDQVEITYRAGDPESVVETGVEVVHIHLTLALVGLLALVLTWDGTRRWLNS